jgi:hypothetical protein
MPQEKIYLQFDCVIIHIKNEGKSMMQLSIEEPKIEKFFNSSKDEIMKALRFIVDNDIHDFSQISNTSELSEEQKKELDSRITSFYKDRSIGRDWKDIKSDLER